MVIFCSGGNDSVALIQLLMNMQKKFFVVYNDTGWSDPSWSERIHKVQEWVEAYGATFHGLESEGMEALVKRKKGWPAPIHGMQFCTEQLKIVPSRIFLDSIDPNMEMTCVVGVRREESSQRSQFPEWTEHSDNHGGRALWAPLVRYTEFERDVLLSMSQFEKLPHGSRECHPCIYANRSDIRTLSANRIEQIARIELELGFTKNGKPRTLFRPYRMMGATGIHEAVEWARSDRGKYQKEHRQCDSGFCGN